MPTFTRFREATGAGFAAAFVLIAATLLAPLDMAGVGLIVLLFNGLLWLFRPAIAGSDPLWWLTHVAVPVFCAAYMVRAYLQL